MVRARISLDGRCERGVPRGARTNENPGGVETLAITAAFWLSADAALGLRIRRLGCLRKVQLCEVQLCALRIVRLRTLVYGSARMRP